MSKIIITETIQGALPQVFATFTDLRNFGECYQGITELTVLTEGPVRKGTVFSETRVMFNKATSIEIEVTAFDANKNYRVENYAYGMHYISDYEFTAVGEQYTRIKLTFEVCPQSFLTRLLSPILGLILMTTRKPMRQDLLDLQTFVSCQNAKA